MDSEISYWASVGCGNCGRRRLYWHSPVSSEIRPLRVWTLLGYSRKDDSPANGRTCCRNHRCWNCTTARYATT